MGGKKVTMTMAKATTTTAPTLVFVSVVKYLSSITKTEHIQSTFLASSFIIGFSWENPYTHTHRHKHIAQHKMKCENFVDVDQFMYDIDFEFMTATDIG